ncbi:MAG: helix-turn-helix transcriptional regulator [Pseudonocardiales bacterium]|nr:helix-turn-helix transcriptional regulator [Pseudonocardiales bacterium]
MASKRQGFAQRRRAVGYTQESFAEHLGVERTTVARWETGDAEPQPWIRPKITRVLQVSVDQLDRLLSEANEPEPASDEHLTYALAHPARVDLIAVARLRERVQDLDARYDRAPSTSLLADTGQCLGQVTFLRAHAPTNRVRRELYEVEAEAATLMGQLVWDASQRRDHTTARHYFAQAITAARRLRAPAAEGLALLRTSFVALYGEKDPKAGLALTTQTAETTKTTSDVLTGLAVLHAAEAHAMLGHQQECEQILGQAEVLFERIDSSDPAFELFSPTHYGRLAGSCYLFLNKAKRAQPMLEHTAQTLRDRSKSQAIALGNLTLAHIRQRQLDEAAAALHTAIDTVETTWGGGGLNVVFGAAGELRPWRNVPIVQDVYDRLLTLMASS